MKEELSSKLLKLFKLFSCSSPLTNEGIDLDEEEPK